jgi:hypothetical protein
MEFGLAAANSFPGGSAATGKAAAASFPKSRRVINIMIYCTSMIRSLASGGLDSLTGFTKNSNGQMIHESLRILTNRGRTGTGKFRNHPSMVMKPARSTALYDLVAAMHRAVSACARGASACEARIRFRLRRQKRNTSFSPSDAESAQKKEGGALRIGAPRLQAMTRR